MLQLFPFLAWMAVGTSAALLVALRWTGDLGPRATIVFAAWWAAAAWCQFFAASAVAGAAGLALQTVLAVGLLARWKFTN